MYMYGANHAEHDKLNSRELKVNPDKCKFNMSELAYVDHVLSEKRNNHKTSKQRMLQRLLLPLK